MFNSKIRSSARIILTYLIYVFVAAIGGLLVGLIGTGNALVIMPTLAIVFPKIIPGEHALRLAAGTTMATMAVGAIIVAFQQHRFGRVNRSLLKLFVLPYFLGALTGPWVSLKLPSVLLRLYLAVVIAIVALVLLVSRQDTTPKTREFLSHRMEIPIVLFVISVCSSVAGIASGIFAIPYLTRFALPVRTIVGTSTAAAAIYSLFGTIGYVSAGWFQPNLPSYSFGFVYLPAFATMAIVVALVGPFGVHLAHRIDDNLLKRAFAIFLIFAAVVVAWRY